MRAKQYGKQSKPRQKRQKDMEIAFKKMGLNVKNLRK